MLYIKEDLINEIRDRDVVLFVGAGLTINLGLPSWNMLIDLMAKELNLDAIILLLNCSSENTTP